jgi:mono/diheme cytochrome c family protein
MPAFWQQPIGAALALTLLTAANPAAADEDASGRGEYLARAGGCFSCHTAAGGQPLAGGRALATPFGTFYSPNITPDPDTGIGRWTDAQFLRALREGVRPDGANYFPVFPYPSFTGITDGDALAIKAYLFSVPQGAPRQPATRCGLPVFLARPANWLEIVVLYAGPFPAGIRAEHRL